VNIEGYELSEPLFRQVSDFRLRDVLTGFAGETLVVQINQEIVPPKPELAALAADNNRCRLETLQEQPFWKEIKSFCRRSEALTTATRGWLVGST
jgi:hypothetical protein